MIRIARTLILSLAALALSAGAAGATHSNNSNPPKDFLVGAGDFGNPALPGQHFSVSAHSGPLGENPRGHIRVEGSPVFDTTSTQVECLVVAGNRAAAGGRMEETPSGTFWLIVVAEDHGQPSDPLPDRAVPIFIIITPPPPNMCAAVLGFSAFALPMEEGNVTVHDAEP